MEQRPDRIALWAVVVAALACLAAGATAKAGDGGISTGLDANGCSLADFGSRTMRLGDCGQDVETLNWILRSRPYQRDIGLHEKFNRSTKATVKAFQRLEGVRRSGAVDTKTRRALLGSLPLAPATWYGPGMFGNSTACGKKLTPTTIGVAHRTLPCGTKVTVAYNGKAIRARVIDRGPYGRLAPGETYDYDWDLTQGLARKLGFLTSDHVRVAVIRR
jgi:hypothetical protein